MSKGGSRSLLPLLLGCSLPFCSRSGVEQSCLNSTSSATALSKGGIVGTNSCHNGSPISTDSEIDDDTPVLIEMFESTYRSTIITHDDDNDDEDHELVFSEDSFLLPLHIDDPYEECVDEQYKCSFWAERDECYTNPVFMHDKCRLSCEICSPHKSPALVRNPKIQEELDIGVRQKLDWGDGTKQHDIEYVLAKGSNYMRTVVPYKFGEEMLDTCKNEHEMCTIWAYLGECDANPTYMKTNCAPVCTSCEVLTVEGRCPLDNNIPNVWKPGDLNNMFTRLSSQPFLSEFSVQVLSSPSTTDGPWIITMDNVISDVEAERLIELGSKQGYKRSANVGDMKLDGTTENDFNSGRTSTNAWCYGECENDPVVQSLYQRFYRFIGIPETNSEALQLLRYESRQFYEVHHDYIPYQRRRQSGVRVLTAYVYLNDVKSGGGTNFDKLDITVQPKRGRVVLWPSVLDDNPEMKDERTSHQALPVEDGIKYGANAWFHLRDFKGPDSQGCT